jgi:hypothetical protein
MTLKTKEGKEVVTEWVEPTDGREALYKIADSYVADGWAVEEIKDDNTGCIGAVEADTMDGYYDTKVLFVFDDTDEYEEAALRG